MNQIRELRESKMVSFSQYHLASLACIPQSRISLIERSLVVPKYEEKERIAKALEVTVEELWPEGVSTNE